MKSLNLNSNQEPESDILEKASHGGILANKSLLFFQRDKKKNWKIS